jgi:hypothetical protein
MAYTARMLITNAYYLSGVVSRSFQTVTGEQLNDGLNLLNALLAVKTIDQRLIPYYRELAVTAVIGQEKYFIQNLIAVETFTFNIGSVRYSMLPIMRKKYFGTGRVDNIQSLPYNWHVERERGGASLYIYFLPNTAYPMKIWGKFGIVNVASENEDLSLVYDAFYIEYLRYALAEYICAEYNITFQPQSAQKLKELEYTLIDLSPKDFSITKFSTLQSDTGINYADVNIGRGWRPS